MLAINDLFLGLGTAMDPELDTVVPRLAKKLADTNSFLSDQAERALLERRGDEFRALLLASVETDRAHRGRESRKLVHPVRERGLREHH